MWKYFPDIQSYITENFTSINTVMPKMNGELNCSEERIVRKQESSHFKQTTNSLVSLCSIASCFLQKLAGWIQWNPNTGLERVTSNFS